ncbi:MAG: anthranilate phosphoribosyltransferase [Flavipsychrobacter sp.]|nr:anthranilate phosphoribosyltransferase [Flavipsychrobacter sp.]
MRTELAKLFRHEIFDRSSAKTLLHKILDRNVNPSHVASFLAVYNMRQPTIGELQGFTDALMESCKTIDLDARDAIDIVGTGGDGKNTFNISTLSALVVAAAGVRVVKHGNYGSTSVSGSSNVLEKLGYQFSGDKSILKRQLDLTNICFLHAPLLHPIMGSVKQVRKEMGLQTIFNLLGPLINPAEPGKQLLGVSHHSHIRKYQYLLNETDKEYGIVHAMDGYDEISLTGSFKITGRDGTKLYYPEDIGMTRIAPQCLVAGNSVDESAIIFLDILLGRGTHQQEMVVIANSAFAIQCACLKTIDKCIEMARTALYSGKAYQILKKIIELS